MPLSETIAAGSVPRVGGRRPQRADRHDDAEPRICSVRIALAPHLLDHLAGLCDALVIVLLNPEVSRAVDVEVGDGHAAKIAPSESWP